MTPGVLPIANAVKRAIGATGTTVTAAGLILAGTFAAFGVAGTDERPLCPSGQVLSLAE